MLTIAPYPRSARKLHRRARTYWRRHQPHPRLHWRPNAGTRHIQADIQPDQMRDWAVLTVWMDAWQMQCCGEPFNVGSQVSWSLAADPGREFLAIVMGDDVAATVTHREEHHGCDPRDNAPKTDGVVRSIQAVRCRYAANPKQA